MTRFIHWRAAQGKARRATVISALLADVLAALLAT